VKRQGGGVSGLRIRYGGEEKGYEGVASENGIPKGGTIIRLPLHCLMSAKLALSDPQIGDAMKSAIWEDKDEKCSGFAGLAETEETEIFALLIWLLHQKQLGKASKWHAYISQLPEKIPSLLHALPLNEEEDRDFPCALKLLPAYSEALEMRRDLKEKFDRFIVNGLRKSAPLLFPIEVYSFQALIWAHAIFWSRALRVPVNPDTQIKSTAALCPLLDSLNHTQDSGTFLFCKRSPNSSDVELVLEASREFRAGCPVGICYGARSDGELIKCFGFVLGAQNPSNYAWLHISHPKPVDGDRSKSQKKFRVYQDGILSAACFEYARALAVPTKKRASDDGSDNESKLIEQFYGIKPRCPENFLRDLTSVEYHQGNSSGIEKDNIAQISDMDLGVPLPNISDELSAITIIRESCQKGINESLQLKLSFDKALTSSNDDGSQYMRLVRMAKEWSKGQQEVLKTALKTIDFLHSQLNGSKVSNAPDTDSAGKGHIRSADCAKLKAAITSKRSKLE